ncbi:restriction endonuclease subunit S [Pseudomonas alliivorans]|nr:restriction endonuclease subunit S [Pseudomonas alliivorans]
MKALLTDNLPLLAGAPNGVKKLRELILELAVRGKLVPQDPNDEPASELLKSIAEERARLIAEGKIRKQKSLVDITKEKEPFLLPNRWSWTSLNEIAALRGGSTPSMSKSEFWDGDIPWVSPKDMHGGDITESELKVTQSALDKTSLELVPIGSILLVGRSGILKRKLPVQITAVSCTINQDLKAISPLQPQPSNYVQLMLRGTERVILKEDVKQGTTVQSLVYDKLFVRPFGLPPLAEQHRIVAKVDELMTLCDRLETQQAGAESAHAQLVKALLDSLIQASDANEFAANWQRLAEHFDILFTTESSIDALKQTFLCLAADGRLVSTALPADYLALSDVIEGDSLNGSSKKPEDSPGAVEILRISAGTGVADFLTDEYEHKWADVTKAEIQKFLLAKDDLLACRFNGNLHYVGAFSLYCGKRGVPQIFPDKLIRFRADPNKALPHYLKYILNAAPARAQIESFCATTVGNIGISAKNLKTIKLRLPPLEEQRNIVSRLDQLMDLCDQLKTRLTQARLLNEQLASTLVERALANDGQQAPAATDKKVARTLLAAEVTHRLHAQRTFGQRKLQKVVYLAEHAARLAAIQGSYLRNVAGPHDRHLMNQVEVELQKHKWYERIDRETVGHAYRPLCQAGQHRQAYNRTWSANEQANIEQVIELMRDWDTDRCEMTVTLYAAWNDSIIEGRPVTDEAILDEVMHRWNEAKLRFSKGDWLSVLTEMKKHDLLTPTGFGKRTSGGTLTLPGFE